MVSSYVLRYYPVFCIVIAAAFLLAQIITPYSYQSFFRGKRPRPKEIGPFTRGEFAAYLFQVFVYPLILAFLFYLLEHNGSEIFAMFVIFAALGIPILIGDIIDRR